MKTWRKITAADYQHIHNLLLSKDKEPDPVIAKIEKVQSLVAYLFGKTHRYIDEKMTPKQFGKLARRVEPFFLSIPEPPVRRSLKVKGRRYIPQFNLERMRFGQYCEILQLLSTTKGEVPIDRLHQIEASLLLPFDCFVKGANPADPEEWYEEWTRRAEDLKAAPFLHLYGYVRVLIVQLGKLHQAWAAKFDWPMTEEEIENHTVKANIDPFDQNHGWQYAARQIADLNHITLDEAWLLPVGRAFNDLVYIREEREKQRRDVK